jgi:hypothetical protein
MKAYVWSPEKNQALKANGKRNICFEDIVAAIEGGGLLADIRHPNVAKYPGQRMLVVYVKEYVYAVPYVASAEGTFLKTAFPSRQLKAIYFLGGKNA